MTKLIKEQIMLLRAVELHNFRGYRNFKLKLAPLTSLLGKGEVGKNDDSVADMIKNGADKVTLNDADLIESMSAIVNN